MIKLSEDDLKRLDVRCMDMVEACDDIRKAIAKGNNDMAVALYLVLGLTISDHCRELSKRIPRDAEREQAKAE